MALQWFALFRPGREEPEAADYDRSDLISLALRRAGHKHGPGLTDRGLVEARGVGLLTRNAAWKRLRRRGWRLEPLPERFWEGVDTASYYREGYAAGLRQGAGAKDRDLLRELAEDRHKERLLAQGIEDPCRGILRTCGNRLCEAAAELLR